MTELSDKVLRLTTFYMGPASAVFLERQTKNHLNGLKFSDLDRKDIPELAKWVLISGSLFIEKTKAEELSKKILTLA